MPSKDPPSEVAKIRNEISNFFRQVDEQGRRLGSASGVYAFYDYDGEPIYVGQTRESLTARVGRHLTGRRTDAVAKFVLDPFEVLEIEVWPFYDASQLDDAALKAYLNSVERQVYDLLVARSRFGAVLNEKVPPETSESVPLPVPSRGRIIPADLYEDRAHPDVRIARRASTIARLAAGIAERAVDRGLREALRVQTSRLDDLATARLLDFADQPREVETDEDATEQTSGLDA